MTDSPSPTSPALSAGPASLAIEVRGLSKSFGSKQILRDIHLAVPSGSVAVLEGDNGSGKTTLVRILATVVSPDGGTVRVDGHDVITKDYAVRRSLGVSFANDRSLYWRITGMQNLTLSGRLFGLKKSVIAERAEALCAALDLTDVASTQVARMSTGQRQRLMVARALISEPPVLLLDEPFRGVDDSGVSEIMSLVANRSAQGMSALIVAPIIEQVAPMADAVYRIEDGKIVQVGRGTAQEPGLLS